MAALPMQMLLDRRAEFLAFVRRRVPDAETAEDLLQGAYMRAWRQAETLQNTDAAAGWFYTILRNAITDLYRRRATETEALTRWGTDHGLLGKNAAEPAAPPVTSERFVCGCIGHVLPTLKPSYAEALREVDLQEAPLSAYAQRHALTANNAAVRVHRARAALRRELTAFCGACSADACLDCICPEPVASH